MKKEEKEDLPKCILIEDLGMLYPKETSNYKKRFGIYECGFCGTHFKAMTDDIKSGHTKSCGCYNRSQVSKSKTKHGDAKTKLYNIWLNIKARTTNENRESYTIYGGRGIVMCAEWFNNFVAFRDWSLENDYEEDKGLSIDRINNDGNYSPENCRWTTKTIQIRNRGMLKNNTSGFKGVSYVAKLNRYKAYIVINKKPIYLGSFKTALEGAIAYNNYIMKNNPEGFNLNVIPEQKGETK